MKMSEEKKDAFSAVKDMLESKAKANELKKTSDVEDVDEEIIKQNPVNDDDYEYFSNVAEIQDDDIDDDDDEEELTEEEKEMIDRRIVEESIMPVTKKDNSAKQVDVNKIKFTTMNELDKSKLLSELLNKSNTSTVEIVAAQSGYTCKLSPLNNKDSFNILNSESGEFENNKMTYKTIYDKIVDFSCGKMSFKEWLQRTSLGDLETFYYGLYCATFLDEGSFKFTCPNSNCGHVTEQIVSNKSLRRVVDFDEMKELTDKISKESNSISAVEELSLVSKVDHIELPQSKMIFEIKLPSLFDLLEFYRTIDPKVLKKLDTNTINFVLCTSGILIPDKKGSYAPFNVQEDKLSIIQSLSITDSAELRHIIYDLFDKHRVSYAIKSVKCAKCGKEIKDIPLNFRSILFTLIYANRT